MAAAPGRWLSGNNQIFIPVSPWWSRHALSYLLLLLKRRARRWIAKSLHFPDQLARPIGRLHGSGLLVRTNSVDRIHDLLLKLSNNLLLLRGFFLLFLIQNRRIIEELCTQLARSNGSLEGSNQKQGSNEVASGRLLGA